MKNRTLYIHLSLIIIISIFFRFLWLNIFPIGMANDELTFVLNAKALFLEGSDLSKQWSPGSLLTIPGQATSELPYFLIAPIVGPFDCSMFVARFPYALIGVFTTVLLYFLVKKLLNERIAFLVGLVVAVNPWSVYVSRTAFEAPIAAFFYLLTLYVLISTQGKKLLLAVIPLLLAFYAYLGTRVLFPIVIPVMLFYSWFFVNKKKYTIFYGILLLFSFLLIFFFVIFGLNSSVGHRITEIGSPFNQSIQDQVNEERRLSIENSLVNAFSNKYTVYIRGVIQKYLGNFSTSVLFLNGDPAENVSLGREGYLYSIDFFLIVLGIIYLFKINKSVLMLCVIMILIAPIPAAIRAEDLPSYALHSVLLYPFLMLLVGVGLGGVIEFVKGKIGRVVFGVVIITYLVLVANFFVIYFFQYPVYNSEAFAFSDRILARYVYFEGLKGRQVYVVTGEPEVVLKNYLFFENTYNRKTANQVADLFRHNFYQRSSFLNLHFLANTDHLPLSKNYTVIIPTNKGDDKFKKQYANTTISQLSDSGEIYAIFNGHTCSLMALPSFVSELKMTDFNVEDLTEQQFCNKYILFNYRNIPNNDH